MVDISFTPESTPTRGGHVPDAPCPEPLPEHAIPGLLGYGFYAVCQVLPPDYTDSLKAGTSSSLIFPSVSTYRQSGLKTLAYRAPRGA